MFRSRCVTHTRPTGTCGGGESAPILELAWWNGNFCLLELSVTQSASEDHQGRTPWELGQLSSPRAKKQRNHFTNALLKARLNFIWVQICFWAAPQKTIDCSYFRLFAESAKWKSSLWILHIITGQGKYIYLGRSNKICQLEKCNKFWW